MKKSALSLLIALAAVLLIGCATLPDNVSAQSKKEFVPTEEMLAFDKSGEVKFLQVQTTAAASAADTGMVLDGSLGEMLIEIKTKPVMAGAEVVWGLKNKGDGSLYVVATSYKEAMIPFTAPAGETTEYITMLDEMGYGYIVVDSDMAGEIEVMAKAGDKDAKTPKGSNMVILWF